MIVCDQWSNGVLFVVQRRHLIPSQTGGQPLAIAFQPSSAAKDPVLSIVRPTQGVGQAPLDWVQQSVYLQLR